MTVNITLAQEVLTARKEIVSGIYTDDERLDYAYSTSNKGVLRVLFATKGQNDWRVVTEISPSGWLEVNGRRYTQDSSVLGGLMGSAPGKSWHAVAGD